MVTDKLMDERTVIKTKLIFGFLVLLYASITCIYAADTISATQTIRYNETIVSPQETFELGFFNPFNSTNHYVGIRYKKRAQGTIVWVANRDKPLNHTFGEITLTALGVLSLLDTTTGSVLWSSMNSSRISVRNPIGQLLETGNFIVYEDGDDLNQENPIWQSFDFMTDTLLPGMKLGWNLVTGVERHFTSWKSDEDPSVGEFSFRIDRRGFPQAILTDGPVIKFRGGPWNGLRFTGFPSYKPNPIYNFTFVLNEREIYYRYDLISSSLTRVVLHPSGNIERLLWTETKQEWTHYWAPISDECDEYAKCGPFGSCNINNSPVCECLKRFEPRSPDQWRGADSSQGCRRTTPLDCGLAGEGFNKYSNLKLPDTKGSWYNETMTLAECEKLCKSNCSCTAYANSNISGTGSGCLLWFGDLIDIRTFDENGDNLYIRMPPSELDLIENRKNSSARKRVRVMLYIAFVVFFIVVSMFLFYRFNRKPEHQLGIPQNEFEHNPETRNDDEDLDLPLFGLSTLLKATQNFSMENKLGEGGFGPVYKGVLEDGQEIAVKRLAKTSTQGLPEFKNEVISISKLQHRNLC